jgi:hypothetical protein
MKENKENKRKKSILDVFKDKIIYWANIGLSNRCIYILVNEELKKGNVSIT